MQARQQPWNALLAVKRNLMNKTWLAMEVQYFRYIGQIPHDCSEYNTCNTSKSMGWGAYKSAVNLISSKNQRQGHAFGVRDCSSHLQKGQRAARTWVMKQAGFLARVLQCQDGGPAGCPLSIMPNRQKAGKQSCLIESVQFRASICHTSSIDGVLLQ